MSALTTLVLEACLQLDVYKRQAYEFPLWVAATFSTVDEVEAALRDTVIVAKSAVIWLSFKFG